MDVRREVSTITTKGQTTVPKAVRQALGVGAGDRITFRIKGRTVTVEAASEDQQDEVVGAFLDFLARDVARRPAAVKALSPSFARRIGALVKGARVDLNAHIEGDVDL